MTELDVPFLEKELAKELGARWNFKSKKWYVPHGIELTAFERWLPEDFDFETGESINLDKDVVATDKEEFSLTAFLYKVGDVISAGLPGSYWVSAEISELRHSRGHMYLTLAEHDDSGKLIARARANIWASTVGYINDKLAKTLGAELTADIKVLIKARAEYHPQYGFSLVIDDIDPSYTLGDMAKKLQEIIDKLTKDKLINNNKQLTRPEDFTRVAVISPKNAAGLGDFKAEADFLSRYKLCEFDYYGAVFQGADTETEITAQINKVTKNHKDNPYDVLVIIRGGGAVSDLAWLNNEAIARAICKLELPVYCGIGHERDYTIIDEVANYKFDTPSKVINHIQNIIINNAKQALANYEYINRDVNAVYESIFNKVDNLYANITSLTMNTVIKLDKNLDFNYKFINQASISLIENIDLKLKHKIQSINNYSRNIIDSLIESVNNIFSNIKHSSMSIYKNIQTKLDYSYAYILGQGPDIVLKRGFTMCQDLTGKPITTAKQAVNFSSFKIKFKDKTIEVKHEQS